MNDAFEGIFRNKRVLITGDTGFKGSWLSTWLHELGAKVFGYALPPKTDNDNYVKTKLSRVITHRDGNVVDYDSFLSFAKEANPDIAFHLAAQPLVLYSYDNPRETYETNLMGTVNFFEIVRNLPNVKAAVNVTSDKCYENKEWVWGYRENDPMGGKDPYSSSKGCSELITSAYINSFFSKNSNTVVASARAGNVIGGGDWAENRIVPDFFRATSKNESLVVRNPDHTRPWQHVLEPLSGYLHLAAKLYTDGQSYSGGWNFGPSDSNHYSVKILIESLIKEYGKGDFNSPPVEGRPHEAHLLKLDVSKAAKMLGWTPTLNFTETVKVTVDGYRSELSGGDVYKDRVKQIEAYTTLAKNKGIKWTN
ncbi:MAG: CDP-glucose 4,6-dehydratase [Bacteroidota bacterium]